jgi:hypothetical protein
MFHWGMEHKATGAPARGADLTSKFGGDPRRQQASFGERRGQVADKDPDPKNPGAHEDPYYPSPMGFKLFKSDQPNDTRDAQNNRRLHDKAFRHVPV